MNSFANLADSVFNAEFTDPVFGQRIIDSTAPYEFQLAMKNDFLTPRGSVYKWQEMTATAVRTAIGELPIPLVPVRYTWQRVGSRTGTPDSVTAPRDWSFARGQGFSSVVLHAAARGEPWPHDAPLPPMTSDVSYPDLPKTPATDLLLMVSWDMLMFEMLCTELARAAPVDDGVEFGLDRFSGAVADLAFSARNTNAVFQNNRMSAVKLGHGERRGRPVISYAYQCLGCDLTAHRGSVVERGTSTYGGTLQLDRRTGDLVAAEFIEFIVATVTQPDGRRLPVQKRRTVQVAAANDPLGPAPSS